MGKILDFFGRIYKTLGGFFAVLVLIAGFIVPFIIFGKLFGIIYGFNFGAAFGMGFIGLLAAFILNIFTFGPMGMIAETSEKTYKIERMLDELAAKTDKQPVEKQPVKDDNQSDFNKPTNNSESTTTV